jgi:hypothetical protein
LPNAAPKVRIGIVPDINITKVFQRGLTVSDYLFIHCLQPQVCLPFLIASMTAPKVVTGPILMVKPAGRGGKAPGALHVRLWVFQWFVWQSLPQ